MEIQGLVNLTRISLPALESAGHAGGAPSHEGGLDFGRNITCHHRRDTCKTSDLNKSLPKLTHIDLPVLTYTRDLRLKDLVSLQSVSAPKLQRVTTHRNSHKGGVHLDGPNKLSELSLPSLTEGDVYIMHSQGPRKDGQLEATPMARLNLPKLKEGIIWISNQDKLSTLSLPSLQSSKRVYVNGCLIASISMPALGTAGSISLKELPSLSSVKLSALATLSKDGVALTLNELDELSELSMPKLQSAAGKLSVTDVPKLDSAVISALQPKFKPSGK
jgi:hypothetical protein